MGLHSVTASQRKIGMNIWALNCEAGVWFYEYVIVIKIFAYSSRMVQYVLEITYWQIYILYLIGFLYLIVFDWFWLFIA